MSGCTEWARSTAPELREAFARPCVGLWPIGATEQHGPHVITGFDHLAAQEVVQRAVAALGRNSVMLPPLAVGCSDHWLGLGATLSIRQETMISLIRDVCRSASSAGLAHLIIVNGHMGNVGAAMSAVSSLFDLPCRVQFVSYWDLIGAGAMSSLLAADNAVGHAGEFETSIALSLPGYVREHSLPGSGEPFALPVGQVGIYRPVRVEPGHGNGVVGDPSRASARTGAELLELASAALERLCRSIIEPELSSVSDQA
jgi:creatinine amidohydrolase